MRPLSPLPSHRRRGHLVAAVRDHVGLLSGLVAFAWILEIVDFLLFGRLNQFGIIPRTVAGIGGIVAAPVLHAGFGHLISNTIPFLVLGGVVLMGGRRVFISASWFIILTGGTALWMFGPAGTVHIGASLLIFGYLGFLIVRGLFEKSVFWVVVGIVILIFYGGMLQGILPSDPYVSWRGHLFGFIAGILAARVMFAREKDSPAIS